MADKKTILLVEDEAIHTMVEAEKITRFGYNVINANSGEKAVLFAIENNNIDLILMDINLGKGIDGTEAARQILSRRTIPIIFLTSYSEREYVDRVSEITHYGYVIKDSGDFLLKSSIEMAFKLFEAHEKIKTSEVKYRRLHETMTDAFALVDVAGNILEANQSFMNMLGYSMEELLRLTYYDLTSEKWRSIESNIINKQVMVRGFSDVYEKEYIRKDSTIFPVELRTFLIKDEEGIPIQLWAIVRDITNRKQAEEKIQKLLAEKELLLKEVHHRIKNHMYVIMSLLSLQASTLKDPSSVTFLQDAKNRVQSMMVLYDKLYRSADFRSISTKEYLTSLIDEIINNFPKQRKVVAERLIDDVSLNAKTLSPVGIIVNEIITNAMKHGFAGREDGLIRVSFSVKDNHATLIISDNGIGFSESVDLTTSTGFGMQLINILTEQLDGKVRFERAGGARFILEFKI